MSAAQQPNPHRFSLKQYYELGELGLLDKRTELLEGIITDMEPVGPYHANVGDHPSQVFQRQALDRCRVRVQYPINLGEKLALYKSAGISEYWVIDLNAKVVHCFVAPAYRNRRASDSISPEAWPNIRIDLEELFTCSQNVPTIIISRR